MPLSRGKTDEAISSNVRKLVKEGFPQDQAVAIAMAHADKARKEQERRKSARR